MGVQIRSGLVAGAEKKTSRLLGLQLLRNAVYPFSAAVKASSTRAALIPTTRITLFRLRLPADIVTDERGTFKRWAKNRMQASLALPSTGAAAISNSRAVPSTPAICSRRALGWTFTENVTESPCG